jgi:hypothetical protein
MRRLAGTTAEELERSQEDFVEGVSGRSALPQRAVETRNAMLLWNNL